jgi:lysozyme family protein
MQPLLSISVFVESGSNVAEFAPAFKFMMDNEDAKREGKVTHDGDGRTRFGICERFHKEMPATFWTSPPAEALSVAETIYQHSYWNASRLGEIVDQAVASKIFDMCVPMGRKEAAILAQRVANGLLRGSRKAPAIDGKIGDRTIAALNACPPQNLVEALCNLSKVFFCECAAKNPAKERDLEGWLNRASSIPAHALGASA